MVWLHNGYSYRVRYVPAGIQGPGVETWIVWVNYVNIMSADASSLAKPSATMLLILLHKRVLDIHAEEFHVFAIF